MIYAITKRNRCFAKCNDSYKRTVLSLYREDLVLADQAGFIDGLLLMSLGATLWTPHNVTSLVCKIDGNSNEVANIFKENEITGCELPALKKDED